MPRPLLGRANGLEGREEAGLIWDGRRTNGLVFSGESELGRLGAYAFLVGEDDGVDWRIVAGEAEFWRRKGDWRPVSWKERGRCVA